MVTETQKRIEAYRELLPGLREKVTAVAFLLALSVIMLTSASYAWLTISRAPEVTAVSTNIAANGSLEIALATGDGKTAPEESKVGDSMAAEVEKGVNPITRANVTWGNLINLNDPSYGLDSLTLRPAQLNTASLLDSPLYGAEYDKDGRITQLASDFGYTTWVLPEGDKPGYFGVSDKYGVRAISSTKVEAVGAEAAYYRMVSEAKNANLAAASKYTALGTNTKYMPSLATMMGLYMTARMNPDHATFSNPDCAVADIQNLRDMYAAFLECFDAEAEAMAKLANLTLFLLHGEGNYTPYTAEMIYTTTTAKLKAEGIQITDLDQFIKDRNVIASDLEKLKTIAESGTSLKWKDSGLNGIVNNLVNVGACTIGKDNTPISSIGASNAMGYLSGTQEARITNGILYRFEERTGGYIEVKGLSIKATVFRLNMPLSATVKANIQTTAPRDYNLFTNDLAYAESQNDGNYAGGIAVAQDTYGLAVDLWVRTNSAGSYLTLEGNVLTESEMVRATTKDANGNEVELYTLTFEVPESEGNEGGTQTLDVYKIGNDYYNANTHTKISDDLLNLKPSEKPKMVEQITILGYEGENRVWVENELISPDATTQGGGSCYVYYAETPEDMERSLKLLESFKVAFVGGDGKKLATAEMDTKNYFAESGRVTVPLVLSTSDSINLGEDYEENITYAITPLVQNEPTRITAIVYLDGTKLTNSEVLSAADIQGQLNIQFGSSQSLEPIRNEDLESKELRISASVDENSFDYDTATKPMTSIFTVNVDGDEPSSVTAYLIRKVNETQGSREAELTFDGSGNTWTCDYTFITPGTYILRTVSLDGVDHDLNQKDLPTVTVKGFDISSFSCKEATNNYINVLTAENSATVNLSMEFATNDENKLPKTVQARFLSENGAVNADFVYNPTNQTWNATATFHSSGLYELKYVVLDNEIKELDPGMWQTASITLGMRVAVYTTSPHKFKYVPSEMTPNQKNLAMQVKILDNAGNELLGLSEAKLTYTMKGSGVKKMDTDLEWDGSYYSGSFPCGGPGIWQFSNVTVGKNTLTTATTSPTFTIQSPEPPEYVEHNTSTYQYAPSNNATMNVVISNSSAAAVQAYIIKNGAAEGTWVDGVLSNETITGEGKPANYWNFKVPTDANGYQDGHWTLTQLKLWDVFAADGTAYTEEVPLEIDVSNENDKTKVVSRVYVTFEPGQSKNFGKDANGNVIGEFMDSYKVSGISVKIHDFENQKIDGISDVKLEFVYGNNSATYGGYTNASLTNAVADFKVDLTDSGDGITFSQAEDKTLTYAGSYTTTFSFIVNGTTMTYTGDALPANVPKFTVWSKAPTVTIDSISPSGSHTTFDEPNEVNKTVTSSINGNTATVHVKSSRDGNDVNIQTVPSVTLKLNNIGEAESATMIFSGSTAYMYTNDNRTGQTDSYKWTKEENMSTRYFGQYRTGACNSLTYNYAGTFKSSKVTLVYSGNSYDFSVDEITIINEEP